MALAVIIAVAVYLNLVLTAEPLSAQGGTSGWYFAQDRARQVYTQAAGLAQSTVPERYGQLQGFVVTIFNYSDWTQTILGPDPAMEQLTTWQPTVAVGSGGDADRGGSWDSQTLWTMPASIPPHSMRLLRVLWISRHCGVVGSQVIFQEVVIRVRVGMVTRTETIQPDQAWGLLSTKTYSCGSSG
jgi:hypothetical protein